MKKRLGLEPTNHWLCMWCDFCGTRPAELSKFKQMLFSWQKHGLNCALKQQNYLFHSKCLITSIKFISLVTYSIIPTLIKFKVRFPRIVRLCHINTRTLPTSSKTSNLSVACGCLSESVILFSSRYFASRVNVNFVVTSQKIGACVFSDI